MLTAFNRAVRGFDNLEIPHGIEAGGRERASGVDGFQKRFGFIGDFTRSEMKRGVGMGRPQQCNLHS